MSKNKERLDKQPEKGQDLPKENKKERRRENRKENWTSLLGALPPETLGPPKPVAQFCV